MSLATRIEALLFASDQPLPLGRLCEVLDDAPRVEVEAALAELDTLYDTPERALCLTQVAGGWQLATKPDLAPLVPVFPGSAASIDEAALESIASRVQAAHDATRVDASAASRAAAYWRTLLERNLVRIAGRSGASAGRSSTPDTEFCNIWV